MSVFVFARVISISHFFIFKYINILFFQILYSCPSKIGNLISLDFVSFHFDFLYIFFIFTIKKFFTFSFLILSLSSSWGSFFTLMRFPLFSRLPRAQLKTLFVFAEFKCVTALERETVPTLKLTLKNKKNQHSATMLIFRVLQITTPVNSNNKCTLLTNL